MENLVLIKGGGDIATGIAHRLFMSGFKIAITELPKPTMVRRSVSFAQSVYDMETTVENVTAKCVELEQAESVLTLGYIPVIISDINRSIDKLKPTFFVDAVIAKCNTGTRITDAKVVIAVGPGFTAGLDVHAVVETMRGHDLGRVYYKGAAIPDTGVPGEIAGYTIERLLRAPEEGEFVSSRKIGDQVAAGDIVGNVAGCEVRATISGIIRGIIQDNLYVHKGMKIGDIDPRCRREHCFTISDKARAVAGGVLEAIMHLK